jgi:N-methylhydantoinase B
VRIPPIKLVARDQVNKAAVDLILSNMRVPDERLGDFHSGMAACRTAEKRIHELVERCGTDTLLDCVRINLARSEIRTREQIARLPDGEYYYEDYQETFGDSGRPRSAAGCRYGWRSTAPKLSPISPAPRRRCRSTRPWR